MRLDTETRAKILGRILDERGRQIDKWGDQRLPDGISPFLGAEIERDARARLEREPTFAAVLLEEVGEAIGEADLRKLRVELVQVAAVCVQWLEDVERRLEGLELLSPLASLDEEELQVCPTCEGSGYLRANNGLIPPFPCPRCTQ